MGQELDKYDTDRYEPVPVRRIVETPPDWTLARAPADPGSRIEVAWSQAMLIPRGLAKGFLILTLTWQRAAFAVVLIGALIYALRT